MWLRSRLIAPDSRKDKFLCNQYHVAIKDKVDGISELQSIYKIGKAAKWLARARRQLTSGAEVSRAVDTAEAFRHTISLYVGGSIFGGHNARLKRKFCVLRRTYEYRKHTASRRAGERGQETEDDHVPLSDNSSALPIPDVSEIQQSRV